MGKKEEKVKEEVTLNEGEISVKDYGQYTPEELKKHLTAQVEWMIDDEKIRDKLIANIHSVKKEPKKEDLEKAAMILDIVNDVVFKHASEAARGAHVMVEDGGKLYNALREKGLVKERISSHHNIEGKESDVSMQAGEIFREFLVGKTKDKNTGKEKTWFQVESHSLGGLRNFIGHAIDCIKYIITGKNVGQYGVSKHVDKNPIEVVVKKNQEAIEKIRNSTKSCAKTDSKTNTKTNTKTNIPYNKKPDERVH